MIGSRLRELRNEADMSQPEFAAIVSTTKQYVSQLELGKNLKPNGELLEGWARHFKVELRWLVSVALWGKQDGEPLPRGLPVLSLSCRECGYLRQHEVAAFRTYLEKLKRERPAAE